MPFAWLGFALDTHNTEVGVYQDDAYFGLRFEPLATSVLADYDPNYFRTHQRIDLPTGLIESVTVALDTTVVDEAGTDAVLAEVVLVVDGQSVPLMAAEAYGPDEWHRLDESVVLLRYLEAFERIDWIPRRPRVPQPFRPQPRG